MMLEDIKTENNNDKLNKTNNNVKPKDKTSNVNKNNTDKMQEQIDKDASNDKLKAELKTDKNIVEKNNTNNSKSNANNEDNESFGNTIKKESMEFIIVNIKALDDLKQEIKEVFGTNKYDENIDSNIYTQDTLLSIIEEVRKVYKNINDMTIDEIDRIFKNIFANLISNLSGTNWRYKHGFIESKRPYEVLIDCISYCARFHINAFYYKEGMRTKGYKLFN